MKTRLPDARVRPDVAGIRRLPSERPGLRGRSAAATPRERGHRLRPVALADLEVGGGQAGHGLARRVGDDDVDDDLIDRRAQRRRLRQPGCGTGDGAGAWAALANGSAPPARATATRRVMDRGSSRRRSARAPAAPRARWHGLRSGARSGRARAPSAADRQRTRSSGPPPPGRWPWAAGCGRRRGRGRRGRTVRMSMSRTAVAPASTSST